MCEECETLHDRTGQPVVKGEASSSFVPSVIKTEVTLDCDDFAHKDLLLQQFGERIEKLSQQDKLSKFCMDAGFLTTVEVGQYFMTKDTAEFSQFHAVACREYTLPREEEASQPQGWIQGNTKIGPVLEIAPCCLHGKYGVEIRIMSVNRDNSHSWVTCLWWIWTTTSRKFWKFSSMNMRGNWMRRILHADRRPKQNHKEENLPALHQEQFLLGTGLGPMLNQENIHSPIMIYLRNWFFFFVMEIKYIEKMMERFNSGELKRIFRNISEKHGRRRRKQEKIPVLYWVFRNILYLRALQGHSGRNLVDPSSQDNVLIPDGFFKYIYHVGCAINLHPSSIRDWYLKVKIWTTDRQYSFCLCIPWTKTIRILMWSTWMNRVMHNKCIKHGRDIRTQCIGSTSILLLRKDWNSIRLDRTQSFFTKHFQLVVFRKLLKWKLEKSYTRKYTCHLASTKDLLETWLEKIIGFRRCSTIRSWATI